MNNFFKRNRNQVEPEVPKPARKTRLGSQVASITSPFTVQTQELPWNPDDLYQKRQGYDIYYEMLKDDQIKAVLETKKNTIIGGGWEILAPTDVEGNELPEFKEQAEFVKDNFENAYDGSIDESFYSMMTAVEFGFSLTEQIYKVIDGKILLSKLSQVPPDTVQFIQDEFGNIIDILQDALLGQKPLPTEKFVHFVWSMRDGNPYGSSDLRPAYIYWFSKLQVIKYRNIFLERHGFPIAVATYNPNEEGQIAEVQAIVKSIQAATSVAIPESMQLEYKQPKIGSADPFDTALRYFDKKISTSLLLPDLLGFNDTKEGSLALGKQHFELFTSIINRYRRLFEQVINEQIIKKLVNFNFPGVTKYPKIVFKPVLEQDDTEKINIFIKAVEKAGVVPNEDDIRHIKQILGFPSGQNKIVLNTEPEEESEKRPDKEIKEDTEEKPEPKPTPEKTPADISRFSTKIEVFLNRARDKFVLDLIGDKLKIIKDIYYLGNIKTQIYKALKVTNINNYKDKNKLHVDCEKRAFELAGDLSTKICTELRQLNINNDKAENIKFIELVFKTHKNMIIKTIINKQMRGQAIDQ